MLSVALPSCCCCFTHGARKLFQYLETHTPHFFFLFPSLCLYSGTLSQSYVQEGCLSPADKGDKQCLPGAEKRNSSPKESGVGHSVGYQQASPHQQDEPWATSGTLCRSLCYSSLVWINKSSSVSLHLTEKMKFEMKLPCWWQWKSKTGMPREMKMKSCKYSRCRPHFFQLMEFYHGLATSKKHLRSCRHVNISFNFLQVNC